MTSKAPYGGSHRKLVVALDVGTTYSGVSYSVLDPGDIPKITPVTRYPAQEYVGGNSKIPSVVYYDRLGNARVMGAEAIQESIIEQAEEEGWHKAEWFKLQLRPKSLSASHIRKDDIPPLPPNKTVTDVLSDFLRYLFECTREYILQTHANGRELWSSLGDQIDFVLTHPNGWEGVQQSVMRQAAVLAGLVPNGLASHSRIQFCTEGEASLHFCIENVVSSLSKMDGKGVIVVDAGGGTIDLSAYCTSETMPISFEEIAPTQCRLQGSIFVSRRARTLLAAKLRGTRYGSTKDIDDMAAVFDKSTKTKFRDANEVSYIKFGSSRDNDPAVGIRSGQLKLPGSDLASLFEPAVTATIEAINELHELAAKPISSVFLVGGFAASDWFFSRLQSLLASLQPNTSICRPDQHVNKAVSDGAISFYLNHFVSTRVAKWTFGIEVRPKYDPSNPEHRQRSSKIFKLPSGELALGNRWDAILSKGVQVSEAKEFRRGPNIETADRKAALKSLAFDIKCYRGSTVPEPLWTDLEIGSFPTACTVIADTTKMVEGLQPIRVLGWTGVSYYYKIEYEIVLLLGLTELKAQICWKENGIEKRGPASIVYDGVSQDSLGNRISSIERDVNTAKIEIRGMY